MPTGVWGPWWMSWDHHGSSIRKWKVGSRKAIGLEEKPWNPWNSYLIADGWKWMRICWLYKDSLFSQMLMLSVPLNGSKWRQCSVASRNPSLRPSYFEPMVRSGFVPAFFGTADSWSLYQSLWIWDCWGWSVRESWGSNPPPISQSLSPNIGYLPQKIYWIHSSWGPSEVWSGDSIDFDCTIHLWGHQVWALPHVKL